MGADLKLLLSIKDILVLQEQINVYAVWSTNTEGGCMSEFHHPLFVYASRRAVELKELLLKVVHTPIDHEPKVSIHIVADLPSFHLKYSVNGCCEECEARVDGVIRSLDHSPCKGFNVKLDYTFRLSVEQFMAGSIPRIK